MEIVNRLMRWLELPINITLWGGLVAGFLMMVHVVIDVTGRTVFNHPFSGTTEIVAGWYMVFIAFLPWAWIERHDNHIVAGMFEHLGGPRFNYWLGIIVKACTIVFIALFAWQTWVRAIQQTRAGEVWEAAGGFIPIWPSRWSLPIAAILMGAYMFLRLISDVARGLDVERRK